jgi:hypothetical protein
MSTSSLSITPLFVLTFVAIGFPERVHSQEVQRSKAQVDAARKFDPEVAIAMNRHVFLKKYKDAELVTEEVETGFRQYVIVKTGMKHIYGFFLDEMMFHITYDPIIPARKGASGLVERFGKPDDDSLSEKDKDDKIILHYYWDFSKINLSINCKILEGTSLGNVLREETINTRILEKMRKKLGKDKG